MIMSNRLPPHSWIGWSCLLLGTALAGCSPSATRQPAPLTPVEENLKHIGEAYRDASVKLQRAPANIEEIKPYLTKYGDPDTFLRSPNDGQPYQIVWGIIVLHYSPGAKGQPAGPLGPGGMPYMVLAYEQTGAQGKRYVLDAMLKVKTMSDEEFAKVDFPPGHQRP
jgi:hypothetical protein